MTNTGTLILVWKARHQH